MMSADSTIVGEVVGSSGSIGSSGSGRGGGGCLPNGAEEWYGRMHFLLMREILGFCDWQKLHIRTWCFGNGLWSLPPRAVEI